VRSELGKVTWDFSSSWLGLQFFVVLPVFLPRREFPQPFSGVGNSTSLLQTTDDTSVVVGGYCSIS